MPGRGFINLLGPLFTRAWRPGASEIKAERTQTASDSTTRATMVTPTSGKKVRIISAQIMSDSATEARFELYFDTGANVGSDSTKAILNISLDVDTAPHYNISWPDGGGPIAAVDDVVSIRTNTNVSSSGVFVVHYREE